MEQQSLLIGKKVKFQISSEIEKEGVVMDKITMKEKINSDTVITGYIINCEEKLFNNIHYWRIIEILN